MLIFSGMVDGTPYVYDYIIGILDPALDPLYQYEFQFDYADVIRYEEPPIETVDPKIEGPVINEILNGEDTEMSTLSITLFWNADEDLDLTFICDQYNTIDWDNAHGHNDCGASLVVN